MKSRVVLLLSALGVALGGAGCPEHEDRPADSRARPDSVAPLVVQDGQGLLFSFYDNRAEMRTVETIAEVAETARAQVMVTHPARRLPNDLIYVTDLRAKRPSGGYRVWVEPKGKWLDQVVPKVSVSQALARTEAPPKPVARRARARARARRRARRRRHRARAPAAAPGHVLAPTGAVQSPEIYLFSTNWCPSCRAARAFFKQKGVPFKELDVERDQQAQRLYLALQQRYGLKRGVIPVIVIGERVFQGFSRPQIEAALAAALNHAG